MRIAYLLLHDFRFSSTGPEEFARRQFHFSKEYAKRMASSGHEVTLYVLSQEEPRDPSIEVDGYTIKTFRSAVHFPPLLRFGNDHSLRAMREVLNDEPDIVHHHNYYLWNFPYVAPFVKRKARLVAQYHGSDPIRPLKGAMYYPSLRLADALTVATRREFNFLSSTLRFPRSRLVLAPSTGVDSARFKRTGSPIPGQLLYVGRIPSPTSYLWEKSPQQLLPLIHGLRALGLDCRLVVAGDGPGLGDLRQTTERLELSRHVDFLGAVPQEELPKLYSQSILAFIPMHMDDIEPFWDGALKESLSCQTPVVAFNSRNPGLRQYGCLIQPGARGAPALARILSDPSSLIATGVSGCDFVRSHCDWEVVIKRLESVYEMVLRGKA